MKNTMYIAWIFVTWSSVKCLEKASRLFILCMCVEWSKYLLLDISIQDPYQCQHSIRSRTSDPLSWQAPLLWRWYTMSGRWCAVMGGREREEIRIKSEIQIFQFVSCSRWWYYILTCFQRTWNAADKYSFSRIQRHRSIEHVVSVRQAPWTNLHWLVLDSWRWDANVELVIFDDTAVN